jgi:hypothetical protein
VEEVRQAASAIVALARVLSLPTTGESDRRRIVESIERTAQAMLLRLGAPSPELVDSSATVGVTDERGRVQRDQPLHALPDADRPDQPQAGGERRELPRGVRGPEGAAGRREEEAHLMLRARPTTAWGMR